ncbi:MAG: DUF4838 domain-containing protein [Thermoguttaceae bacterium]|nr:DUF4838 domain-containing protein [Thermoguttaceae bacterium]
MSGYWNLFKKRFRENSFLCIFLVALVSLVCVPNVKGDDLQLAASGNSDYKIVLPTEPSPVQTSAANELQSYFKQVTDAELPIVSETDVNWNKDVKAFIIGPGKLSQQALGDVDESAIGYDGVILKSVGNSIVLSGSPKRGPIYAVYEFLETKLGCKWWTSTESTIPHLENLTVTDDLDVFYTPKLEYRESFYLDTFNGPFAVKIKCNGNSENIPEEFGGSHKFQFFVHSSFYLIPPEKYFLDHPDWFSEIDGVRKVGHPEWAGQPQAFKELKEKLRPEQIYDGGTQLCFSNDEMIAEMVKNVRAALSSNPNASFLSISQNDWHGYCTCEKCRAIDEEEGSHAGSLLRGVNKVAEALEDEFPNLYVETLAYQYTRKPPKITKPRKNVVIRLCSIECSFAQPLDSEVNQTFRDDLVGWSKIADKLFVWDYATDFAFYLLPFPNYRVLAPNIRFYVDHNVVGFFEQGDYQCETGDFVQLRNWVVAKLLWNPSLDPNALVNEFIEGYYAPELVPIYRRYFDVLSDAVEKKNYYLGIFKTDTRNWLDSQSLIEATKLQNEALEIAKSLESENPERYKGLTAKVRRERIPLDVVWLQEYRRLLLESRLRGEEFAGPKDPLQAAKDLCAKFDEFGLTRRREWEDSQGFNDFKASLVADFEGYVPEENDVPEICRELPENSWLALQEYGLHKEKLGEWTFVVQDKNASNGRAVKMPGNHFEWATSWNVSEYVDMLSPKESVESSSSPLYHVYAYVRCDADVDDGVAMTAGIYDSEGSKNLSHKTLYVPDIKNSQYVLLDLGSAPLTKTALVWFAPPKRPGEVDSVYVDQIIIVREK